MNIYVRIQLNFQFHSDKMINTSLCTKWLVKDNPQIQGKEYLRTASEGRPKSKDTHCFRNVVFFLFRYNTSSIIPNALASGAVIQ
jgi:hypothetical protein